MVSRVRGRTGRYRARPNRSDFEPGAVCFRRLAGFGRIALVGGFRRLGAALPEITTGSRAEDKNQLTIGYARS